MDGFSHESIPRSLPAPLDHETKTMLDLQDGGDLHLGAVEDSVPSVGQIVFAVVAPGKEPFSEGKPSRSFTQTNFDSREKWQECMS